MSKRIPQPPFLPTTSREMAALGWDELDILLVSGDAYADHPSFASALLGRWLIENGYRTGLIAQPNWQTPKDLLVMGRPRLLAGVGSGAVDSMLAHYTAFRKKRHDDAFTPGGQNGARPNRAVIVYSNLLRQAFPGLPLVIGGIEASLRRLVHYDFWSDGLRRPIILDAKADVLVYGMGERAILEVAKRASHAQEHHYQANFRGLDGTVSVINSQEAEHIENTWSLPSWEEINLDKKLLVKSALISEELIRRGDTAALQAVNDRFVIVNKPAARLTQEEMDRLYDLPFSRQAHPNYTQEIPALNMIHDSINSHRGCGGGCSFCSLALHQGRQISSRSRQSIINEAENLVNNRDFKGSITDVGGPSANMWQAFCQGQPQRCKRSSCLFPSICQLLKAPQLQYVDLLRSLKALPGVKSLRVASGLRFDLALREPEAVKAYVSEFTGGQLKVAPEHSAPKVLQLMRKPEIALMEKFVEVFRRCSQAAGKEQYIIPYLMSAFPGCGPQEMQQLSQWLKKQHWQPQQVQCFIPTPGTVATAMYYAGCDEKGQELYVARSDAERLRLHAYIAPPHRQQTRPNRQAQGFGDKSPSNSAKLSLPNKSRENSASKRHGFSQRPSSSQRGASSPSTKRSFSSGHSSTRKRS